MSTQASRQKVIESIEPACAGSHASSIVLDTFVSRTGLAGLYAKADCSLGYEIFNGALEGRGAYLFGKPGRGKTYAAACAVRLWTEYFFPGRKRSAWLVQSKRLLDQIKRDYDEREDYASMRACNASLLVLDDLGAERVTDWSKETLESILDHRLSHGLPTIVTSNYKIGDIAARWGGVDGERIASRLAGMCGGKAIEVSGNDMRLRQ